MKKRKRYLYSAFFLCFFKFLETFLFYWITFTTAIMNKTMSISTNVKPF